MMIQVGMCLGIVLAAANECSFPQAGEGSRAIAAAPHDKQRSELVAARKEAAKRLVDRIQFRFPDTDTGLLFSITQYGGSAVLHMVYGLRGDSIAFKFVRDGNEMLEIPGHTKSTFRTMGDVLYFAHFAPSSHGCAMAAYDLNTGKMLWRTQLNAVGYVQHSGYSNRVAIGFPNLSGLYEKGEGAISITGQEGYGDYVEILDRQTGEVLAHKIYRKGFPALKKIGKNR